MTELTPPFLSIPIGEIRNFTLFTTAQSEERTVANAGLYELPAIERFFPERDMQLVGFYNDYGPIMIFRGHDERGVYVLDFDELNNPPILVVQSLAAFYEIVARVRADWEGLEGVISMKKTPENLRKREQLLQLVSTISPKADLSYWDFQVFRELGIGMS